MLAISHWTWTDADFPCILVWVAKHLKIKICVLLWLKLIRKTELYVDGFLCSLHFTYTCFSRTLLCGVCVIIWCWDGVVLEYVAVVKWVYICGVVWMSRALFENAGVFNWTLEFDLIHIIRVSLIWKKQFLFGNRDLAITFTTHYNETIFKCEIRCNKI